MNNFSVILTNIDNCLKSCSVRIRIAAIKARKLWLEQEERRAQLEESDRKLEEKFENDDHKIIVASNEKEFSSDENIDEDE